MTIHTVPNTLDSIKKSLVALKMARALEVLDATLRKIEQGEINSIEALDHLLVEELTLRENRRVKAALMWARLTAIKTLASFDFAFQPSLDRSRVLALAELKFIDRAEVVHLLGPPGTGKSHLATALAVEARRHHHLAGQGRAGWAIARAHSLFVPSGPARGRRDRVSPGHAWRRQPVLPARKRPLRERRDDPHIEPWLRRVGRGVRRSGRRHRPSRSAPAPRRRDPDRRIELSPASARRSRA